jgi:hypothetical protein
MADPHHAAHDMQPAETERPPGLVHEKIHGLYPLPQAMILMRTTMTTVNTKPSSTVCPSESSGFFIYLPSLLIGRSPLWPPVS